MLLAVAGATCLAVAVRTDSGVAAAAVPESDPALRTPVWSPRRVPPLFAAAASAVELRRTLPGVIAPYDGCVSVDDADGPVAAIDDGTPLAGASTQKLLVAAAALAVMGPDHRFPTRAMADAPVQDGVLAGDLTIVGGGDPMLTTADKTRSAATPVTRLSELADAIVAAGVHRIDGSVIADDSRYDRARSVPDWSTEEHVEGDIGALGALVVDGGRDTNGIAVSDPALDTVQSLASLLSARGVEIGGGASASQGAAPAGAHEIARVTSAPLRDIVGEMLTDSNNETAELLTRELGVQRAHDGTTAEGTHAITTVLEQLGVPVTGVELHDGSGLAHDDRITCRTLMGVLGVGSRPRLRAVLDGLPIAGRTGTLAARFNGTVLVDRLRAKTGHISGVVGLAGVVAPGARFAFVGNGDFSTSTGEALQDRIAAAVATYLDAPGSADLVPAPHRSPHTP